MIYKRIEKRVCMICHAERPIMTARNAPGDVDTPPVCAACASHHGLAFSECDDGCWRYVEKHEQENQPQKQEKRPHG